MSRLALLPGLQDIDQHLRDSDFAIAGIGLGSGHNSAFALGVEILVNVWFQQSRHGQS